MVTSFRPRSPLVRDESVLTGVRPISNLSELYSQYTRYRLEVIEERVWKFAQRPFDIKDVKTFLTEQKEYIESMIEEIVE